MIISIFGIYFNIIELTLLGFLLLFLPAVLTRYGTGVRLRRSKLFKIFLAAAALYLACILISIFGAVNESRVLKGFFKWLEIFGFAILIFLYVRTVNHFKKIYWIFWISNFALILIALVSIFLNNHFVFQDRLLPDYPSAIALGLIIPFARKKFKLAIFLSLICFLVAFFSLTRGVWVVLFFYLIMLLKDLPKRKKLLSYGLAMVSVSIILWSTPMGEIIKGRLTSKASNTERFGMAVVALQAFSENPINGVGTLNFPDYLMANADASIILSKEPEKLEPHNVFLQIAAEEGILGLSTFLVIIFILYYAVFKESKVFKISSNFAPYLEGLKYVTVSISAILFFAFISDYFRLIIILFMGLSISLFRLSALPAQNEHAET